MLQEKPSLIYEDNYTLVFDKPSGMVSNISETSPEGTLQNFLQKKLEKELSSADPESEFYSRSGLVHRLDKETSGVILVAKDEKTFKNLQAQFKSREVVKEYVALVFGEVDEEQIEVNAPLARNPTSRTKMAVVADGKAAVTIIEKIWSKLIDGEPMSLVRVFPKTGRTHQIRVHLAAVRHPVAGDGLYAGRKRSAQSREIYGRLMLHAHKITLRHPNSGERVTFEAPTPKVFK